MKELEQRILVSRAARRHGLDSRTLKRWLQADLGYDFSQGGRLVLAVDVEAVIIGRTAKGEQLGQRARRLAGAVVRREKPAEPVRKAS